LPASGCLPFARFRDIRERGKFENLGGFALPSFGNLGPLCPALTEREPGTHGGRHGGTFEHRTRGYAFAADKVYSSKAIRDWLRQHKIEAVIPAKSNERKKCSLDREKYRQRNVVERCINWLKEARRIATRYEKMAVNFLAMAKLAIIQRCFRLLDSSDRP
jgi:transposase